MGSSLLDLLVSLFLLVLIFTFLAFPTMKFYARPIPAVTLFGIAFWIFLRVGLLMGGVFIVAIFAGHTDPITRSATTLLGLVVGGWLISTELAKRGYSKPFPGIGTRTVLGMIVLSWIGGGIVWAVMRIVGRW